MECQEIIPLRILSEEDAWNLFVKKTRKSFHESTKLYDVARRVARECAGLPVALIAVARALGDKDIDDWTEAARRLKAAQPANYEDEREVLRCIKLSYDHLRPDDDNIAKFFFLLCCLFPEDSEIEVEDLLVYALGKGLFRDADTIKAARAKAHSVVKYLKASSLLLDSACYGFVKMHDVIRDVAISISLSEDGSRFLVQAGCGLKDWPANIADEGYSAISLMRNEIHKLPNKLICDVICLPPVVLFNPNWVSFNICISRKGFMKQSYYGRFFERKLTVKMDAHRHLSRYLTLNTSMKYLPDWFIDVVTEKTEILEYTGYKGLDNILVEYHHGRLHELKYLGVIDCYVDRVLMNSITWVPRIPVFESLIELYLEGVGGLQKLCVGELPAMSLGNLKLLNVRNCPHLVHALIPSNMLPTLQNLEILHCEHTKDAGGTEMEYVFAFELLETEKIVLPKLREITLCYLVNLKSIWCGHPPGGVFSNLNSLAIHGCQKLKYLLDYHVAISLFQLELLWVEQCSDLETVIESSRNTETIKIIFPKLKELYLNSLPQLRWIYRSASILCPSLEHLYVCLCPRLSILAAADFQSKNHVQTNDEEHFAIIFERLFHRQFNSEEVPQFFSKKRK
ncbi:PREDICTED: disease resistance protein RPS2-like [Fragaria vesca subsp. vesca]